jgi:hypothetical protein
MATGWRSSYYRYRELFLNVSALYKKRADLRAFLEIVLSIIAVMVFLLFALKPTALTIISLIQQIKEEKVILSSLTKKVGDLQKANVLLVQNQNYIGNINLAVPSTPNPENFAKQIQGLAAKNNVNLTGLTLNDLILMGTIKKVAATNREISPLPEDAYEMGYSISIKGDFVSISNFLKDLENLRIISAVDAITISSSVTDTERVIVAVISGRAPFLDTEK